MGDDAREWRGPVKVQLVIYLIISEFGTGRCHYDQAVLEVLGTG